MTQSATPASHNCLTSSPPIATESPQQRRVAIYSRKSVAAKADEQFTSLEAQWTAVNGYILSQAHQGWAALPTRYEDDGFSGANTARPGFQRLCEAIKSGKVDVLAVYKMDRVSRSQADLHQFLHFLQEHGVEFVSITESWDTTTPHGRAMIGVLAAFSQLERETTAERTRDKVWASRKKGLWTGGRPVLGYGLEYKKLVVLENEGKRVRAAFQLYLEKGSIMNAAKELNSRGWGTKEWTSKEGRTNPSRPFTKATLQRVLTNPIYLGKTVLKGEVFDGEHEAIIDQDTWDRVQAQLRHNGRTRGRGIRNKWNALLNGLLHCGRCGAPMGHTYTKKPNRLYRYYACMRALDEGVAACPNTRVSAPEVERFVLKNIQSLGQDDELRRRTLSAWKDRIWNNGNTPMATTPSQRTVDDALGEFTEIWEALPTLQKTQALRLLLRRATLDPDSGHIELEVREPGPIPQPEDECGK